MAERVYLLVMGCFVLVALFRIVTGRDDWDYRRANQIALERYIRAKWGMPDWNAGGRWVATIAIILVLFGLFLLWVGSFG